MLVYHFLSTKKEYICFKIMLFLCQCHSGGSRTLIKPKGFKMLTRWAIFSSCLSLCHHLLLSHHFGLWDVSWISQGPLASILGICRSLFWSAHFPESTVAICTLPSAIHSNIISSKMSFLLILTQPGNT